MWLSLSEALVHEARRLSAYPLWFGVYLIRTEIGMPRLVKGRGGLDGNGAQAIADGASLKQQCSATRPSLGGAFTPGLCPIKRQRRESDVRSSIG
jgi:hypothetical protein